MRRPDHGPTNLLDVTERSFEELYRLEYPGLVAVATSRARRAV